MKNIINGAKRRNWNSIALSKSASLLIFTSICFIFFTSCKKELAEPTETVQTTTTALSKTFNLNMYTGLSSQLSWELQQARAATAKYQNLKNAIKDGYADINVISENMGYHYMRTSIVDANFEITKPEILVYNKDDDGNYELVAVEYAVPLTLPRPEGFTGSSDVWNDTSGFPFWLLHAWVWEYNPLGVFNPTNPNVHLH
jgi:hypothetical protein